MSFVIHVGYEVSRKGLPSAARIRSWAEAALRGARRRRGELSIVLMEAEAARLLNRDYRQRDYATNVLSFPVDLPAGVRSELLGDLVICAPVIMAEAKAQEKTVADHCAHMVVHGCLHLLGFDHLDDIEAETMEALETRILAKLGVEDPYAER